jgi:hypothetical protein
MMDGHCHSLLFLVCHGGLSDVASPGKELCRASKSRRLQNYLSTYRCVYIDASLIRLGDMARASRLLCGIRWSNFEEVKLSHISQRLDVLDAKLPIQ